MARFTFAGMTCAGDENITFGNLAVWVYGDEYDAEEFE
jgi:hypothetical protein